METPYFSTGITVDQSAAEVFNAIKDVQHWWQGEIVGTAQQLGDEFDYRMPGHHYSKQKVVELIPNQKVVWLVTDSDLKFKNNTEWTGTELIFEIKPTGHQTELLFTHKGLNASFECYGDCSWGWTELIQKSLLSLITTGQGMKVFG